MCQSGVVRPSTQQRPEHLQRVVVQVVSAKHVGKAQQIDGALVYRGRSEQDRMVRHVPEQHSCPSRLRVQEIMCLIYGEDLGTTDGLASMLADLTTRPTQRSV